MRLATEKYSPSPESLKRRMMHLTNYSVNKHADTYVQNQDSSSGLSRAVVCSTHWGEFGAEIFGGQATQHYIPLVVAS